ncbi:MAG: lysophospholipid acyltransferase family protein [Patescibacteria group bacterium]
MLKKVLREIFFIILLYTICTLGGLIFLLLRLTGRINLLGTKNLKKEGMGILVVANHPSYLEAIFLPYLFFPKFLLSPFRDLPWSTPDYQNILAPRGLFWLRYLHMIPIYRGGNYADTKKNAASHRLMLNVLEWKGTVILFPEGGRTKSDPHRIRSKKGKEMRPLQPITERIQRMTHCMILPVWIDGTDKVLPHGKRFPQFWKARVIVKIGRPIEKPITTAELENVLLELADVEL